MAFSLTDLFMLLLICALCYTSEIHISCEFDLENIAAILPYLPEQCTTIYNERLASPSLYQTHLEESQKFQVFYTNLDSYEKRNITNLDNIKVYPFEAAMREKIYTQMNLAACVNAANNAEYLKCMTEKRLQLIGLVPYV